MAWDSQWCPPALCCGLCGICGAGELTQCFIYTSTLCRGCDARAWTRLLIRPSTALMLHLSHFTARARCYQAGSRYASSDGRLSSVISSAPQDFPLRTSSDGPTVKSGNYPFKLDPLNIAILGEMPVYQQHPVTEHTWLCRWLHLCIEEGLTSRSPPRRTWHQWRMSYDKHAALLTLASSQTLSSYLHASLIVPGGPSQRPSSPLMLLLWPAAFTLFGPGCVVPEEESLQPPLPLVLLMILSRVLP